MNLWSPSVLGGMARASAVNGSLVTAVAGAGSTLLLSVALPSLSVGQVVIVGLAATWNKVTTAGATFINNTREGGPGNVDFGFPGKGAFLMYDNNLAGGPYSATAMYWGIVTTSGAYTLGVRCTAVGGDCTFTSGSLAIQALIFQR